MNSAWEDLWTAIKGVSFIVIALVLIVGWVVLCATLGAILVQWINGALWGGLPGGVIGVFILMVFLYFMALRER